MYVLGVGDHPVQPAHAAAAGPERIHRSHPDRVYDAVVVLGVNVHRQLAARVTRTAIHATGVVSDDRPVRNVTDELLEARGSHRRAEDEQRTLAGRRLRCMDVVGQRGAGDVDSPGHRFGHGFLLHADRARTDG